MRLAADGVRFLARRSARGEYSVIAPMPGVAAVVEVRAPQLGALQVAEWSRCAKAEPPIWTEAGRAALLEVEARYARAGLPTLAEAKAGS